MSAKVRQEKTGELSSLGAGINLKPMHYKEALEDNSEGLWFEVHTENYLVKGGPRLEYLEKFSEKFPISFHGVGASLGCPLDNFKEHIEEVGKLVKRFNPVMVSEHATWSGIENHFYADLLPLPKTKAILSTLCESIDAYQMAIGREIAIENPSNYIELISEMNEVDFLMEISHRTGCKLLIDVNNLYISANNCDLDPYQYLQGLDANRIAEIHIAGFDRDPNHQHILIDSHGSPVSKGVWDLLSYTINLFGHKPILLERDDNIPSYQILAEERQIAQDILDNPLALVHAL